MLWGGSAQRPRSVTLSGSHRPDAVPAPASTWCPGPCVFGPEIGVCFHRCPGHHVDGGSSAEILVGRETIYGASIRAAAERAMEAPKEADRLACDAWNKRMLGFQGPAQPSPALGDALNADYRYLEVKCLGCNTYQTVALDIVRRPTPIHELERYMRCRRLGAHARECAGAQPAGKPLQIALDDVTGTTEARRAPPRRECF